MDYESIQRKRLADGIPTIEVGHYRGYGIRVVAGYNIVEDTYFVHLYLTPREGQEVRVFNPPRRENNIDDALKLGFAAARSEIDALTASEH